MTSMRWAIILAACCVLLSPGLATAQTWTDMSDFIAELGNAKTPITVTNIPTGGMDNLDVFALRGGTTTGAHPLGVASCGPIMTQDSCPPTGDGFTEFVDISPPGGTFFTSVVGWGPTGGRHPKPPHWEAFVIDGGTLLLSHNTRDGANPWSGWSSLGGPNTGTNGGPCILSDGGNTPQAISQAKGMISVFVVGCDNNLWNIYFQSGKWSGWVNVTAKAFPPANNIDKSSTLNVVYSNFRTATHAPSKQIHVIVADQNSRIWDINYAADASNNYNPKNEANWFFVDTGETTTTLGIVIDAPGAAAAVDPPGDIVLFNNTAQGTGDNSARPIVGVQIIERSAAKGGAFVGAADSLTVNAGLSPQADDMLVTPTPVTLGTSGSDCKTFPSCRDGVFFLNGAQNIQDSIWGVGVPGTVWDRSFGIQTIGSTGDIFDVNPAVVVSQQGADAGKLVYVFTGRKDLTNTLCPGNGDDECGTIFYTTVTP